MSSDLAVLESVQSSNIPSAQKSRLMKWYERATGHVMSRVVEPRKHIEAGGHAIRKGGEGVIVGALAGLVHAEIGLDQHIKGKAAPLDAGAGIALLAASAWMGNTDVHHDLSNAGGNLVAIYGFRKTHDWAAAKKESKGEIPGSKKAPPAGAPGAPGTPPVHGEGGGGSFFDDPIVRAARGL